MPNLLKRYATLGSAVLWFLATTPALVFAADDEPARIFFNAKVFAEVAKAPPANAERTDLQGKSLFPGFIDAHSHTVDGGISLISADASSKILVRAVPQTSPSTTQPFGAN